MFEKESLVYGIVNLPDGYTKVDYQKAEDWRKGAEFGYNLAKEEIDYLNKHWGNGKDKANEWHYVKDGDLPKEDNKIVLCICGNGYIDGKVNYILKLLTRKEFSLFQPVYRWKEIVLPELQKKIE